LLPRFDAAAVSKHVRVAQVDGAQRGVNNLQAYILTNDPNFNPGLYDIDARQLAVVQ